MLATLVICRNPLRPELDRDVTTLRRPRRIEGLAPKTHLPLICLLNGQPLLRRDWHQTVKNGDVLTFITLPQGGGGGSNPLQVILTIGLMVVAGPLATSLAGSMGVTSTLGMSLIGAGVKLAGSMLINALVPPPRPPSPQLSAALAAPSPTYSLNAQGNAARLGSAIPVQYGRHIAYPDFAAEPYAEFVGNEQFLYQLMVIGQGEYEIESVRLEDTPVANFEEITYELVQPGQAVTLFPSNVVSSLEVAGAEALSQTPLGPFVVNSVGTEANYIGIDVVCPKGLFYANDAGGMDGRSVSFTVEAQLVDQYGVGVGSWLSLGSETISASTNTPQRKSYRYAVAAGRYQVKLTRTDNKDTSSRAGHDLNWAGLRAYLPGSQSYGGVTLIAMRMKASNNLSQAASRRVNVIATRKLPTWHPVNGWSAPVATRSPAWAIADILRADYGAGLADAYIDLSQLYVLSQVWSARGDEFNGRFDNTSTVWEALTQVARVGRAKVYQQGGIVHVVRDQAQSTPVAMFSPRNTVKGSLKVDYLMPTEETADAVVVQYFDSESWKPAEVSAALAGSTSSRPVRLQLFGCTSRAQAWREGMYMAACNRYRRRLINLSTEMEGFIPTFGDLVAISSERLSQSVAGEVVGWAAVSRVLTLSEPVSFTAGQDHFVGLRKRDGSFSGPWLVTAGATAYQVVLSSTPDLTPYVGDAEERTHFTFGVGAQHRQLAVLTSAKPRGQQVELAFVNEDAYVHQADLGTVPPPPEAWQLAKVPTIPAVAGLTVVQSGTVANPQLAISWQPATGADHYLVEQSADGVSWTRAADTTATHLLLSVSYGAVSIRVAGIGLTRGAWAVWGGSATGAVIAPPAAPTLAAVGGLMRIDLSWSWPAGRRDLLRIEIWAATSNNRASAVKILELAYPTAQSAQLGLDPVATRYYWARVWDTAGNVSDWYPSSATAGVQATTISDASALLAQLQNSLGVQQLANELAEPIGLIPALQGDLSDLAETALNQALTLDVLSASSMQAAAAVSEETEVRANDIEAMAQYVQTVQARLDTGDFATVKTTATATANALTGVEAKWGVQVQAMGDGVQAVSGITLLSGASGESVFAVLADRLLVYKPDGNGDPKQLMVLGEVGGVAALGLDGNLIVDGSISAQSLNVNSLSAVTADLGEVTAGLARNAAGTNFVDFDATGTESFIKVGSNVDIKADGSGVFARAIVSPPDIVASGAASVSSGELGWRPWGEVMSGEWLIDTGINVQSNWYTASTDGYVAMATIASGYSWNDGCAGHTTAEVVLGDGLIPSGSSISSIEGRIFIVVRFFVTDYGDFGYIQPTSISWKLARI